MKSQIISKRFLLCPSCFETEFLIEHLLNETEMQSTVKNFGFWYCHKCDVKFVGTVFPDGEVKITEVKPSDFEEVFSLLKFRDWYLVVKGIRIIGSDDSNRDYYFHSHQCPTNLLSRIVDVFDQDGYDPHGQIRLVAEITCDQIAKDKTPSEIVATLEELFKLFKTDGKPVKTTWPPELKGSLLGGW